MFGLGATEAEVVSEPDDHVTSSAVPPDSPTSTPTVLDETQATKEVRYHEGI